MTKAKYSAEERAERMRQHAAKLVAWSAANPISEEQRARKSAQMKARWAGMSDEEKKQKKAALREAIREAYARNPEYRRKVSEAVKKAHADGKMNPGEMTEERRRKISEAQKGKPRSYMPPGAYAAMARTAWEKHKDDPHYLDPLRAKQDVAVANSIAEMKTNPRRGRFVTNLHAKDWHVRDPRGVAHHFRNLRHFIRNNPHLFTEDELRKGHLKDPERCKIEGGFTSISPRSKRPCCSWHGWTWIAEKNEDQLHDPLERMVEDGAERNG